MSATPAPGPAALASSLSLAQHLRRIYAWPRLRVAFIACSIWIVPFLFTWQTHTWILFARIYFIGFACVTAFGLLEAWPRRLPRWTARWALQVIAVTATVPIAVALGYQLTTLNLDVPWWRDSVRIEGALTFTFLGMLNASWIAVAALLKHIKEEARQAALRFDLERSELERNALTARLNLLQGQVQPHFLFNTLANIRELVVKGSPQAPLVLDSLIAYLRAAVPRLNQPMASLGQELDLVKAYLEVMHMRMPDRLQFSVGAPSEARALHCPPMMLLTLVENAMRHGIDPTEDGGRIDVNVCVEGDHCVVSVTDTGRGMRVPSPVGEEQGLGTGLANLRERLAIAYAGEATLSVTHNEPRGVKATLRFPVDAPPPRALGVQPAAAGAGN